jgi:hypothetical protein
MIGYNNDTACFSLGALSGTQLPEQYLTPMNEAQIKAFVQNAYPASSCSNNNVWGTANCYSILGANSMVEGANLMYVNKLISWDELQQQYAIAAERYARANFGNKSFLTQLKEIGFIFASAALGISGGPVGFFAGGAGATAKIIADARAARAQRAQEYFNTLSPVQSQKVIEAQKAQEAEKIKAFLRENKNVLMIGGGVLVVGGLLLLMD